MSEHTALVIQWQHRDKSSCHLRVLLYQVGLKDCGAERPAASHGMEKSRCGATYWMPTRIPAGMRTIIMDRASCREVLATVIVYYTATCQCYVSLATLKLTATTAHKEHIKRTKILSLSSSGMGDNSESCWDMASANFQEALGRP